MPAPTWPMNTPTRTTYTASDMELASQSPVTNTDPTTPSPDSHLVSEASNQLLLLNKKNRHYRTNK